MNFWKHISLLAGLTGATSAAQALAQDAGARTFTPGQVYQLVSKHSGKCLDVRDHSFADGASLQQWACTGKTNQKFLLRDAYKGAVNLIAQESQKAVRIAQEDSNDGTAIVQSGEYPGNTGRFNLVATASGAFNVVSTHNGKCLDVSGPSQESGALVQQWACHGGANQEFYLVKSTDGMGERSWDLKNTGLQADSQGRVFRYGSDSTIARVDVGSGRDVWSHTSPSYAYANYSCNDSNLYVSAKGFLKALNADHGGQIWKVDLSGENTSYYCVDGYGSLFVVSGEEGKSFKSIEKSTGHVRWEYTASNYLSYLSKEGQNVYVTASVNGKVRIAALESGNGHVRWTRDLNVDEYPFADMKGRIYVRAKSGIQKLDFNSGNVVWTFAANSSDYVANDFAANGNLYFRQGLKQKSIDPNNGKTLWTHEFSGVSDSSYLTASVLKNSDLILSAVDGQNNSSITRYLSGKDGRVVWEKRTNSSEVSVFQDRSEKIYLRKGRSVDLLDSNTGASQWSFTREFATPNERFYAVEAFGEDLYVTYGDVSGRYPPMGLLRLDARTGAMQWDKYLNESIYIISADSNSVIASGPMNSHVAAYKR